MPTDERVTALYGQSYYIFGEAEKQQRRAAMHVDYLAAFRIAPGKLLDLGCANGDFILLTKSQGYVVHGIDVSRENIARARATDPDLPVSAEQIEQHSGREYDIITMWDVIEHFNHPRRDILAAYDRLKKGGVLLIETPNIGSVNRWWTRGRWIGYNLFHLLFFDKDSIITTLRDIGFSEIHVRSTPINKINIIATVMRYDFVSRLFKKVRTMDKIHAKRALSIMTTTLRDDGKGDSLIVYARK